MNTEADKLINLLKPEIEKKCTEIAEERRKRKIEIIFSILCILAFIVPVSFVIFEINLSILLFPMIFSIVSIMALAPIIINQQGGKNYEQV